MNHLKFLYRALNGYIVSVDSVNATVFSVKNLAVRTIFTTIYLVYS